MSSAAQDERLAAHLRRFSPSPSRDTDAGLRALSHYERRLPRWRHRLRQKLIPVVRWETPYLARMQQVCRSHVLDSYFAFTANLGTHMFFMTFLPICFWCGYGDLGIALVHMLGLGVYLSGAVKDLVCLPRPLSPPLQRITMSGSAALEYGFPSTHTTNAVSVALFYLHQLYLSREEWSPLSYRLLCLGCYCYATSITLGRMYCGMHGFFDVVVGGIVGAFITWLRVTYGTTYDLWILAGDWTRPTIAVTVLGLAVKFHPEPADNCPCFDDSVAFLGVIMGCTIGTWHYTRWSYGVDGPSDLSLSQLYASTNQDLIKSAARLLCGIIVIFMWRAVMKPTLLRSLPPIFRFVDYWGFSLPRRYFLQARHYKQVPPLRRDDNIIPSASEIPSMLSSIRNPRSRRVSVGPQSEADAREFIANREQRRTTGRAASSSRRRQPRKPPAVDSHTSRHSHPNLPAPSPLPEEEPVDQASVIAATRQGISTSSLQVNTPNIELLTPPASDGGASSDSGREDEKNDREMFSLLEKPRTHYDVEVVTKLVVYAGIAWLAVEGNPILFERLGLV